ncbi:hypothetical protein AMECASPLE_012985, partial [Ameca splendens]
VKYWRQNEDSEGGAPRVVVSGKINHTRLESLKPSSVYIIEIRGFNSAGYGPPSKHIKIHTKKPPPDRPPKITVTKLKGQFVNVTWEHVEPLSNESIIEGYRVLYKQKGMSTGTLYTTNKRYIELPLHTDVEYVVEVRAHTEGGDGAVAQISVPGNSPTRGRSQNYSGAIMSSLSLDVLPMLLLALLLLNL